MAAEKVINYLGEQKIYNKEAVDALLKTKQDVLEIDEKLDPESENPVENKAIAESINLLNKKIDEFSIYSVKVGETMSWPQSEVVEREVVSDAQIHFIGDNGKEYTYDIPEERQKETKKLCIATNVPDTWHALDGTAELDATDYPELAEFFRGDNTTNSGKIWLPYVKQGIIKVKY